MEKYTVDIDKVLDAFEESEALEAIQVCATAVEDCSAEPDRILDQKSIRSHAKGESEHEPHGDEFQSDASLKKHQLSPSLEKCAVKQNSTQECSCTEEFSFQIPRAEQTTGSPDNHTWNYEIYYKSFQPSGIKVDGLPQTSSHLTKKTFDSEIRSLDCSVISSHGKDKSDSALKSYSPEEEVLCVSVQRGDCVVNSTSDFSDANKAQLLASSRISPTKFSNDLNHLTGVECSTDVECVADVGGSSDVKFRPIVSDVTDNELSVNRLVSDCTVESVGLFSTVSVDESDSTEVRNSVVSISDSERNMPVLVDQEANHCDMSAVSKRKTAIEIFDVKDSDLAEAVPTKYENASPKDMNDIVCSGVSASCVVERKDAVPSVIMVNFSEIPEPEVNLQEVNEYLNDLAEDEILDVDSGVSSQEDVNGNNISPDAYLLSKESGPSECADTDAHKCKVSAAEQVENIFKKNELSQNVVQPVLGDTQEKQSYVKLPVDLALGKMSLSESKTDVPTSGQSYCLKPETVSVSSGSSSICDTRAISGAIPKREPFQNFPPGCSNDSNESEHDVPSAYADNGSKNELSVSSKDTVDNCNVNVQNAAGISHETDISSEFRFTSESVTLKADTVFPTTRLVFSPSDGIFRSVPYEKLTSPSTDTVHDLSLQSDLNAYDKDVDNTALMLSENQSYPPRLQRPTTLNLPCRTVAVPEVAMQSDIPSLVPSAVEEPPTETLIELDDSSPSDADKPEPENILPDIGFVKPFWIPDSRAANCMHCNIKFTVIKRRHHCRACGKVLCSRCCNQRARLPYLKNKEERVCQQCFDILTNVPQIDAAAANNSAESPVSSSCGSSPSFSPTLANANLPHKDGRRPHPNNPDDYCSTVSPLQQMQQLANRPPPTVMVPVGVLKRGFRRPDPNNPDDYCSTISPLQQMQQLENRPPPTVMVPVGVLKRDGIRPGGDLTDLTEPVELIPPYRRQGRKRVDKLPFGNEVQVASGTSSPSVVKKKSGQHKTRHRRIIVTDSEGPLPPILFPHDDPTVDDKMDVGSLLSKLQDEAARPIVFAVTKNLHILVKITKLDCCFDKECWCFTSHGLCTVGQDEVIFILERFHDEDTLPRDVFRFFSKVYDNASKGFTVGDLGHIVFPEGIFNSWEHRGFIFVRPTYQCLSKLVLPSTTFLFAILIQKWEVPWAKIFPLRLMLRLGAECRYYPCSLVSIRFRKPVYFEIGQTIMSVLADLRNYQFTIPFVPGLVVHMEEKKTSVNIPRNRYEQLIKVLNSNNVEHVLALGSNFSIDADSHLVCMQREEGDYQTQAINIEHTERKVTGASFIAFSGALKSSTGLSAKFSIVEDGLLVQIPQETMAALHSALRDMHDLTINCGPISASEPDEVVVVQWTADDKKFNIGVTSPVDGRSLEGVPSMRIHTSTDYAGENYLIRWTEVFFMELDKNGNNKRIETIDPCKVAENIAQAFCMALLIYLDALAEAEMTRIGLRVTLDAEQDKVEYDVGALGQPLPSMYMNALDSCLIPVISRITGASQEEPVSLELIFYIILK